jgi:ATP-dependent helicase/nuclease subunit A
VTAPNDRAKPLADQPGRDRIREDLEATLVVEAASGTGKTTELVRRMIAALASGAATLDAMVAVTFTEAAAGELKLRIREEIEKARVAADAAPEIATRLTEALRQLEEAHIGTIHAFCTDLLRERPVEAGVDPRFEVAAEDVASSLFTRAFDRWFEEQLAAPGEAVRRILRRAGRDRESPRDILREAALELAERRDFPAGWTYQEGFAREAEMDGLFDEMRALSRWADKGDADDYFTKSLKELSDFVDEVTRREAVRGRDHDDLESMLLYFAKPKKWHTTWTGFRRASSEDFPKEQLLERRAALRTRLDEFIAKAGADLAPRLRDELWPVIERFEHLKTRSGCLDFTDLLLRARNLLRDHPAVRGELQKRFTHLFVDEFQDTDPLQVEILLLLAADDPDVSDWRRARPVPGKLFLVGDPKQSIYRFRRADVALYEDVKERLLAEGAELVRLTVSFRSVPEIQQAVNAAFEPLMRGETRSQPTYVPLSPHREGNPGQPAIVALSVPAPYGDFRTIVKWQIEKSLPDAVAAFVHWLVRKSGWTVTVREGASSTRVAVQPRHVCLLFRRMRSFNEDMTREYARALEDRHIPHLLVGGASFHRREEVEAVRNALEAIERPEDEMAVFATLRGPLFALGDAELLAFRVGIGSLHPFRPVPADAPAPQRAVGEALGVLRELHRGRNYRPIADTIGRLLAAVRAHAGLAIWPTGEQALANVTRFMDLARRIERRGAISFREFVTWLADQAEQGEAGDAPIVEEGTEGVRIMTVHRAKGLEFPVVVLADMTARATPTEPSRWVDPERRLCAMRLAGASPPDLRDHAEEELRREKEEATRILYVAATRARDLLIVPAVGDGAQEGWIEALNKAIYPAPGMARTPQEHAPSGCPPFGEDTTPGRPSDVPRPADSVAPGLHAPQAGLHGVVWWDPGVLDLGVTESVGLAQQKLLTADESGEHSEQGVVAHTAWQEARARTRREAGSPSLVVATATELAMEMAPPAGAPGAAERVPAGPGTLPFQASPGTPVTPAAAELTRAIAAYEAAVSVEDASTEREATAPAAPAGAKPAKSRARKEAGAPASGSQAKPGAELAAARERGQRFGTLVHAILAAIDLEAGAADVREAAALYARVLGADVHEIDDAVRSASRALAHPLLRRAAKAVRAGSCRREVALTATLPDGRLMEGVADAAFLDEGTWTVVDFKTDADLARGLEGYRRQVALYAWAIARATGKPARGVLLKV